MAAVILFGLLFSLILSFTASKKPKTSLADLYKATMISYGAASLAYLGENNSFSGSGGEEDNSHLNMINDMALLGYAIPSASPELVLAPRRKIITYAVKEGDTISKIAEEFGISTNTLLWTNNLTARSVIKPNDNLEILPVSGTKYTVKKGDTLLSIAARYKADVSDIIEFNELPLDGFIRQGDDLVLPGGIPPTPAPAKKTYASSNVSAKEVAGYFIYPTSGRNWGMLHPVNAIDIANQCGTPIYAAAGGKITEIDTTGWNRGYGNYLMISHPNGVQTLYAHFSQIVASAGETVDQGQLIGYMGTTGKSTGCHLHFEVRGAKNPFARY